MADTTFVAPFSAAQLTGSGLNAGSYLMIGRTLTRMAETFNPMQVGAVAMVGMLGGNGTDTLRVPEEAMAGLAVGMSSVGSETGVIAPSSRVMGYTDFTIGDWGIGYEQTYKEQMIALPIIARSLSIDDLMAQTPGNVIATIRTAQATAIAGVSSTVGSSAAAMSLDTVIAARNAFNLQRQNFALGRPILELHSAQVNDLQDSTRTEPWFQANADWGMTQGLQESQYTENWAGMGFDLVQCDDVTQSGGAYQGAAFDRGGCGVAFGNTSLITPDVAEWVAIPGLGLLVQKLTNKANQATRAFEARAYIGVAMGSTSVFRQVRVRSAV